MKIKLEPKAYDNLKEWLPETVISEILNSPDWMYSGNPDLYRIRVTDKILSNPSIYGMILIDWMKVDGTRFEVIHVYDIKSFCQKVEAFAKKEFE